MEDIRKKHLLLDIENEIKYREKILNSNASDADKAYARKRIKEMEAMRAKVSR